MADLDHMEAQIDLLEQQVQILESENLDLKDRASDLENTVESLNAEMTGLHAVTGLFMRAVTEGRADSAQRMLSEALEGWMKVRISLQQRGTIPPDPGPEDEVPEA